MLTIDTPQGYSKPDNRTHAHHANNIDSVEHCYQHTCQTVVHTHPGRYTRHCLLLGGHYSSPQPAPHVL